LRADCKPSAWRFFLSARSLKKCGLARRVLISDSTSAWRAR
jgi:hypothetical protein